VKAIVAEQPGGPEQLHIVQRPDPQPAADEVLIKVAAAGVNRADVLQRQGFYPPPPGVTDVLGLECSGTVLATGSEVTSVAVGDQVCALLSGGGYAELVAVPAAQVFPIPAGVSLVAAAGLPEVAATVVSNLHQVAGLRPGEWLLVHGGGSGIGTFAIQWAKAIGANVIVTVGSPAKAQRCLELGADAAIEYRSEDFAAATTTITDGHGADVILDIIGAKYLEGNLKSLAVGGRLVVIGLQGGVRGEIDLAQLLARRASITATSLRARPAEQKAAICAQVAASVWPMVADGRIQPVIDQVLNWKDVSDAHEVLAGSSHVGKVILQVGDQGADPLIRT